LDGSTESVMAAVGLDGSGESDIATFGSSAISSVKKSFAGVVSANRVADRTAEGETVKASALIAMAKRVREIL